MVYFGNPKYRSLKKPVSRWTRPPLKILSIKSDYFPDGRTNETNRFCWFLFCVLERKGASRNNFNGEKTKVEIGSWNLFFRTSWVIVNRFGAWKSPVKLQGLGRNRDFDFGNKSIWVVVDFIFGVCDEYFYDSRNVYYMRAAGENFRTLGLLNTNF